MDGGGNDRRMGAGDADGALSALLVPVCTLQIILKIIMRPVDSPCQDGGSCVNNGNGYYCSCAEHYSGKNCEGMYIFQTRKKS